jgi:hypothetical protein
MFMSSLHECTKLTTQKVGAHYIETNRKEPNRNEPANMSPDKNFKPEGHDLNI